MMSFMLRRLRIDSIRRASQREAGSSIVVRMMSLFVFVFDHLPTGGGEELLRLFPGSEE